MHCRMLFLVLIVYTDVYMLAWLQWNIDLAGIFLELQTYHHPQVTYCPHQIIMLFIQDNDTSKYEKNYLSCVIAGKFSFNCILRNEVNISPWTNSVPLCVFFSSQTNHVHASSINPNIWHFSYWLTNHYILPACMSNGYSFNKSLRVSSIQRRHCEAYVVYGVRRDRFLRCRGAYTMQGRVVPGPCSLSGPTLSAVLQRSYSYRSSDYWG